jgi:quinol monooxygenase YgiN
VQFSVQYHPEASPGPQDSFYLFEIWKRSERFGLFVWSPYIFATFAPSVEKLIEAIK